MIGTARKIADGLKLCSTLIKVENEGLQRSGDECWRACVCAELETQEKELNKCLINVISVPLIYCQLEFFVMVKLEPTMFPSVHLLEFIALFQKNVCVFRPCIGVKQ